MQRFRDSLRAWLNDRQWSYSDLERESGISNSVISRWFATPPRRPTPANLDRLSKALGVPYEHLLRLCDYLPDNDQAPQPTPLEDEIRRRTARIQAILEATEGLPEWVVEPYISAAARTLDRAEEELADYLKMARQLHQMQAAPAAEDRAILPSADEAPQPPSHRRRRGPHRPIKPRERMAA